MGPILALLSIAYAVKVIALAPIDESTINSRMDELLSPSRSFASQAQEPYSFLNCNFHSRRSLAEMQDDLVPTAPSSGLSSHRSSVSAHCSRETLQQLPQGKSDVPSSEPVDLLNFESAEHESIGNKIILYYDSGNISGLNFDYTIASHSLSYGLIVALAGDFYANWKTFSFGNVEQISDNWDGDPERSIGLAEKIIGKLLTDEGGYLKCILRTMQAQENDVREAMKKGQDSAQVYHTITDTYDPKYTKCTNLGYLWIALCNWDHFGIDAVKAYSSVHTAALRQAKKTHVSQSYADLKLAYFQEAFAQHFLTDLFSTGHLRTPRRILHWTYLGTGSGENEPTILYPDIYPADLCAQRMHNEDCANGLWVTNQLGESWAAYGDKQLPSGKSARNFLQAVRAAQAGVLEVWNTRQTGVIPNVSDYSALKMIPILDNLPGSTNYIPLFRWSTSYPDIIYFREDHDRRNDTHMIVMPSKPGFPKWKSLLKNISASGVQTNMYPFTRSFLSESDVWHIREASDADMIINNYGPVNSGDYGKYWSMKSQNVVAVPEVVGSMQWVTATSLGKGIYSLVGRLTPTNSTKISARHVGLKISQDAAGQVYAVDMWSSLISDGNSYWTEGDTAYGVFSSDDSDLGMVKYWTNGPRGASKLELWTILSSMDAAPVKVNLNWTVTPLNFMLPYLMQSNDNYSTFIGYGHNASTSSSKWYFSTWKTGYSTQVPTTIDEAIAFPAQVLLSGKFGTDDDGNRLVRIFYGFGPAYPTPGYVRIDMLNPSRDSSTGNISFPSPLQTQTFLITWNAYFAHDYLTWFLADVNGNNRLDLVALIKTPNSKIAVIVFPGLKNFAFGSPVVSPITLDPSVGSLLNASFMTPIKAGHAQYTYPETTSSGGAIISYAAIVAFFDNYGVLGARMLAPVTVSCTYVYELKGQTPAIAGQVSQALGLSDENCMGRGERPQGIGFFIE